MRSDVCSLGRLSISHTQAGAPMAWHSTSSITTSLPVARRMLSCSEPVKLWQMGLLADWCLGQYERAQAQAQLCVGLGRQAEYLLAEAHGLSLMGALALSEGSHAEARWLYERAIAICRRIGQRDEMGWMLAGLVTLELAAGNLARAREYLVESLQIAVDIRSFMTLLMALLQAALHLVAWGEMERAVEVYAVVSHYPVLVHSEPNQVLVGRPITVFDKLKEGQ